MRPVLVLAVPPPPPSSHDGSAPAGRPPRVMERVWLNTGKCGLVKNTSLDPSGVDEKLSARHAVLYASPVHECAVVVRLSERADMAVRRREGGERTILDAVGDAATVRPGDCIVRAH